MTTLLSWIGVDTHGPASLYIASDSRISWGIGKYWNVGRKIFASKTRPELFGYCGSVTFPIQILGQLVELIDCGLLFVTDDNFEEKLEKVRTKINDSYRSQPVSQHDDCEVIYASRVGSRMSSTFHAAIIKVNAKGVTVESCPLPETSGIVASAGTGKTSLQNSYDEWVGPKVKDPQKRGRTSRSVFGSFCDALASGKDPYSGAPPQLVGLYREGAAKSFGVIYNGSRFMNGIEVNVGPAINNLEWRNSLFERCCGETMNILKKAQRQPKPDSASANKT
jgi:hypothetical protein